MRILIVFLAAAMSWFPALAQQQEPTRPAGYSEAEESFKSLEPEYRVFLQVLLMANDNWQAVPNLEFSTRLFNSIRQFQRQNGLVPDGILSGDGLDKLVNRTLPVLKYWGLENVPHPKGQTFLVPKGVTSELISATESKLVFRSANQRAMLSLAFAATTLDAALSVLTEGQTVVYKVKRADFMVALIQDAAGTRTYYRYHKHPGGVIGFAYTFYREDIYAERLANVLSSALYMQKVYGKDLFAKPQPKVATAPSQAAPPKAATATNTATPGNTSAGSSSGTGFFVTDAGHIVTNAHVVDSCETISVSKSGEAAQSARLIASDKQNDLAVISVNSKPEKVLNVRTTPIKLGESVAAFGFPLSSVLSRNGNFTLGNITAMAGLGDDSRYLQISTAIQPGNSGGPLLDYNGNLIGIVSSTLDAIKFASRTGDIPQNVNFAIKANTMVSFLDANRIPYSSKPGSLMQVVDLAEHARLASVFIRCSK